MKHLERALNGQNQIWKYIVLFLVAFFGGQLLGSIPLQIVILSKTVLSGNFGNITPQNTMNFSAFGLSNNLALALVLLSFVTIFFAFALLVKPFHKRTLMDTVNARKRLRVNRIWMGILVWGGLLIVSLIFSLLTAEEGEIVFQLNLAKFIPLLLIVLILIPFQTSVEEILFRGYLAQGVAARTRSRWWALIIPTVLFGLMHSFNPEVKEFGFWLTMPQYILMGALLGIVTILDDGLELALGIHFINNAFAALFTTHASSALQTDAMFLINNVDPVASLIEVIVLCVVAFFVLQRIYKWNLGIMNKKVEIETPPVPDQLFVENPITE